MLSPLEKMTEKKHTAVFIPIKNNKKTASENTFYLTWNKSLSLHIFTNQTWENNVRAYLSVLFTFYFHAVLLEVSYIIIYVYLVGPELTFSSCLKRPRLWILVWNASGRWSQQLSAVKFQNVFFIVSNYDLNFLSITSRMKKSSS